MYPGQDYEYDGNSVTEFPIPRADKGKQVGTKKRKQTLEQKINTSLGNPMGRGSNFAASIIPGEEQIDNARHYMTGALTSRGIQKKFPTWMQNYTPIPKIAGFIGSNALGAGHEASVLYNDRNLDKRSLLDRLKESGEDMFNNLVGSVAGTIYNTPREAEKLYDDLFSKNLLPDGIVDPKGREFYLKKEGQKKGKFGKYNEGGLIKAQGGLEYMNLGRTGSDNKEVLKSCGRAGYDAACNAEAARELRKLAKEKGPKQLTEWEDITTPDKEEKKALKEQFKLIKDKYPGLDFNMFVAANRDASRTNVQFGQPERYGKYFDPETGKFLRNTDTRNVDDYMRFYRKQFPKQTKISATDVLDVYNRMPGGLSNYERYVNEGYFPYTPTVPNQRYGGDPSIPNLQSPISMYKKGGPVSKIRIKAYGGPMVDYMKGKMTGPNIF
jgi:hypothetical protein